MEQWKPVYVNGQCIGVGVVSGEVFSEIICESVLPDNDEEYAEQQDKIVGRMKLMAASPDFLKALKEIVDGLSDQGPRQIANAVLKKYGYGQEHEV